MRALSSTRPLPSIHLRMNGAFQSLRVSYGLYSQEVVDLVFSPAQLDNGNAISLTHSRAGLSLRTEDGQVDDDDHTEFTILARLFSAPARLETTVNNIIVETPPSILDCCPDDGAQFSLPLHCYVLLAPGMVIDFTDYNLKIAMPRGAALPADEGTGDAPTAPPVLTKPHAPRERTDSETESEEESSEPIKQAGTALAMKNTAEDQPMDGKADESQDGITQFLAFHQSPIKTQRTYGKPRKRALMSSREHSTAATIPDSASNTPQAVTSSNAEQAATSFNTPKATIEAAARSVRKPSLLVHDGADGATLALEDVDVGTDHQDTDAEEDETPRDEVVISQPSTAKRPTASRASALPPSTQQRRGAQRASKTPATSRYKTLATPAPALRSSPTPSSSGTLPNKVLLSSSKLSAGEKTWLKRKTAVVDDVPGRRAKFICVVRDVGLPATLKVLRSLIADKPVVSDQWVTDSKGDSELLDPSDYLHKDLRGSDIKQNDRRHIWTGKTLFFTTTAAKSYGDDWEGVQLTASESGARAVEYGNANKGGEQLHDTANIILFGTDIAKDRDAQVLISEYKRDVYDKAMFSKAIIRADLDLASDEFKLVLPSEGLGKATRGRGR